VEDLADVDRRVAVCAEVLRECDDVRHGVAEERIDVLDLQRIGPQAGQQARSRRTADGVPAIGPIETNAARRQAIDPRAMNVRDAVAAQLRPEVVHGEEQDIPPRGPVGRLRGRV
jgi:hypothetical protein